jgi:hypothetical protein
MCRINISSEADFDSVKHAFNNGMAGPGGSDAVRLYTIDELDRKSF